MRPTLLDSFFTPVTALPSIGPKICNQIAKILDIATSQDIPRIVDLVHLMPYKIINRQKKNGIAYVANGEIVTLEVTVGKHYLLPFTRSKRPVPYRVHTYDETGELTLVFFHPQRAWLEEKLPIGHKVLVSGRIEAYHNRFTMIHPDYIVNTVNSSMIPEIEPVYPLTAGLSAKILKKTIDASIKKLAPLPEWIDPYLIEKENFPSYKDALYQVHAPQGNISCLYKTPARRRLAYDELLAGQVAFGLARLTTRDESGIVLAQKNTLTEKFKDHLPFLLTKDQNSAVQQIAQDMASGKRMLRLLQGDVGSGKTVVAFLAMLQAAENGGQSALMVPIEILARQHFSFIEDYTKILDIEAVLLTGREKGKKRKEILEKIETGKAQFIIGTHALIQEDIRFHNLVLAIIDEQHRFGVQQRLVLTSKGFLPHLLVMTATPIPRSLVLTAFGDMDVTNLYEKPSNRKKIKTVLFSINRIEELIQRLYLAVEQGEKVYWICPLVEESEILQLTSVIDRFNELQKIFGEKIGLVHGKLSSKDKDAAMQNFIEGKTRLLIATTVIEVGIDVKDATIMIIEHAERFGLAQLHQLRGRVGRGEKESSCILLYKTPLSQIAKMRLETIRQTEDGFRIAEEDLRLRGEGDLLGTKQSGLPGFKIAEPSFHADLLTLARKDAQLTLQKDRDLTTERGKAIRNLLYLYRREEAIKLLRAG